MNAEVKTCNMSNIENFSVFILSSLKKESPLSHATGWDSLVGILSKRVPVSLPLASSS